jgi:hypothetical protein
MDRVITGDESWFSLNLETKRQVWNDIQSDHQDQRKQVKSKIHACVFI